MEVDVTKPFCRGHRVVQNDEVEIWVSFKYEKLPNFCYWCGKVSHSDKNYDVWLTSKGTLRLDKKGYGAWLCAISHNLGKAFVTKVSGMGDGLGHTQFGKTSSTIPCIIHAQKTLDEQTNVVACLDQLCREMVIVDKPEVSNLVSSNLVEGFL